MKQFLLTGEPDRDGIIRLEGGDYHYLVRVRRMAAGDSFPAVLPGGAETLVQILSIERGVLTGKCTGMIADNHASKSTAFSGMNLPPIVLFQALPGGEKMDLIVRQAAEGGITEIVPFVSEFSIAKIKNGSGRKFSRWERIIREARQQSGSQVATAIQPPLTMDEIFNYWRIFKEKGAFGLLFHHQPLEKTSLHCYLNNTPQIAVLAIGPEGGFSETEVSRFLENGFKPLTIGDTILRTETAALYCAAAVRILLLERDSWELKQAKTGSV